MNPEDKQISYKITNTYSTLNKLTDTIEHVWFVCHGMGYLSRYFINYFNDLNKEMNYVIAPQAQSKYYITPKLKHVGASWLTKENTIQETENVMEYFDSIFENESINGFKNLIILGYSQGVSVVLRYIKTRQLQCSQIVLMSGGIPKELTVSDFSFLKPDTIVSFIYGDNDAYLNEDRILQEKNRAFALFGHVNLNIIPFEGIHEVNKNIINQLVN